MEELCIDLKLLLLICVMSGYCSGTYEYQSVTRFSLYSLVEYYLLY